MARLSCGQDVVHLAELARKDEPNVMSLEPVTQPLHHVGSADVDAGDGLGVEDHRSDAGTVRGGTDHGFDAVSIGEEEPALNAQDDDAWWSRDTGMPREIDIAVWARGVEPELGHVWA